MKKNVMNYRPKTKNWDYKNSWIKQKILGFWIKRFFKYCNKLAQIKQGNFNHSDFIKMKSLFLKNSCKLKRHTIVWENIITKHVSQKGTVCKIYTEFVRFSSKTNNVSQQIATPKKINRLKITILKHARCYWSKLWLMKILTRDATRRTKVKKYSPYPSVNVNLECGPRTLIPLPLNM